MIVWALESSPAEEATTQVEGLPSPHGGYTMTSNQCQVCHSSHTADDSGEALMVDGDGGCVFCHGATAAVGSSIKVSADGPAEQQGGFQNEDGAHGTAGSCSEYECHPRSPHGAGISTYEAARSALLSDDVDPLIAAALRSGATDSIQTAVLRDEWVTEQLGADFVSIDVYQPALDGANATAITDPGTAAELALGRAIVTGYTCMNHGCHINGTFNGLSPDATIGSYDITVDGRKLANGASSEGDPSFGSERLRTLPIGGHGLFPATGETAYAACGTCTSCHDALDVRRGDVPAFPHSNAVWRRADASQPAGIQEYGYVRLYTDAAWFTLAGSANQTRTATSGREISAVTPTYGQSLTVAMDGACLKCHRSGSPGHERGVGIDY